MDANLQPVCVVFIAVHNKSVRQHQRLVGLGAVVTAHLQQTHGENGLGP